VTSITLEEGVKSQTAGANLRTIEITQFVLPRASQIANPSIGQAKTEELRRKPLERHILEGDMTSSAKKSMSQRMDANVICISFEGRSYSAAPSHTLAGEQS